MRNPKTLAGAALLLAALGTQAQAGPTSSPPFEPSPNFGDGPGVVEWFAGPWFSVLNKARAEKKGVVVVYWAEGFPWCDKLIADTLTDSGVADALDASVAVHVDLTRDAAGSLLDPRVERLSRAYPVRVLPSLFFVDSDGRAQDLIAGYIPPQALLAELRRIQGGQGTRADLEAQVAASPEDIALRLTLAQKLRDLGDDEAQQAQMDAISKLDPESRSEPMRRRALEQVVEAMEAAFNDDEGLYDTEALQAFLGEEANDTVLFAGWSYLADLYWRLDRPEACRKAHAEAWKKVPGPRVADYGLLLGSQFWQMRENLSRDDARLALTASASSARSAEENKLPPTKLAAHFDVLACCLIINGEKRDALAAIERALKLDPANEALALRRDAFRVQK